MSIRNPLTDHLLTPQNSALLVIDFQPPQVNTIRSMAPGELVSNAVALIRTANLFALPVVLTTVNVKNGTNPDTIPQLRQHLSKDVPWIDRTSINAWEDAAFHAAVLATGRRKLIIAALWTEVCLAFPALDALNAGYEVYAPVDCVGGTSAVAHSAALQRISDAGAHLVSWISVLCELQRDWARTETTAGMIDIGAAQGGPWSTELALKPTIATASDKS